MRVFRSARDFFDLLTACAPLALEQGLQPALPSARDAFASSHHARSIQLPIRRDTTGTGLRNSDSVWYPPLVKTDAWIDTNGHQSGHYSGQNGHEWTRKRSPLVSDDGPARIQISKGLRAMAARGNVANQSGEGCRNVVRSSFVVAAECCIIRSTCFQPRQGGDMACV